MMQVLSVPAILAVAVWWLFGGDIVILFLASTAAVTVGGISYLWVNFANDRAKTKRSEEARESARLDAVATQEWQESEIKRWYGIARKYKEALVLRYRQLVSKNVYGREELDGWRKELTKFRQSVGISGAEETIARFDRQLTHIVRVWVEIDEKSAPSTFASQNPFEYERWCADILRSQGWDASITKASGDQGVDIIATKGGLKVAIQCKLYSSAVGNKAVQEIHAAAAFVDAASAVVVSNVDFTLPARQLASKLGVVLLHHSQLSKLESMLKPQRSSSIIMPSDAGTSLIIPRHRRARY